LKKRSLLAKAKFVQGCTQINMSFANLDNLESSQEERETSDLKKKDLDQQELNHEKVNSIIEKL